MSICEDMRGGRRICEEVMICEDMCVLCEVRGGEGGTVVDSLSDWG